MRDDECDEGWFCDDEPTPAERERINARRAQAKITNNVRRQVTAGEQSLDDEYRQDRRRRFDAEMRPDMTPEDILEEQTEAARHQAAARASNARTEQAYQDYTHGAATNYSRGGKPQAPQSRAQNMQAGGKPKAPTAPINARLVDPYDELRPYPSAERGRVYDELRPYPSAERGRVYDELRPTATEGSLRRAEGGRVKLSKGGKPQAPRRDTSDDVAGGPPKILKPRPKTIKIPGRGEVPADPLPPVSEAYKQYTGREHQVPDEYPAFDAERAARIAQAYEQMKHDPTDPRVRKSYDALIDETMGQYGALKDRGYEFSFMKPGMNNPYAASPSMGYDDLQRNGRMWVYPTDSGFGTLSDISDNPLLKRVGKVGDLDNATANDAFRIVHDMYGHHGAGNSFFRAPGEERAYINHRDMFSDEAIPALTSETRGQNSWLNYGPHGERNRTANQDDTVYGDQKSGFLPEWVYDYATGGRVNYSRGGTPQAEPRDISGDYAGGPGVLVKAKKAARIAADPAWDPKKMPEITQGIGKGEGPVDLSAFDQRIPGIVQEDIPRFDPPKGVSKRMQDALNDQHVLAGIEDSIRNGKKLGADKWYHNDPLYQEFVKELGLMRGHVDFMKYMDYQSAASPRSKVPDNIRNSTYYYVNENRDPRDWVKMPDNPAPYGHLAQNLHRKNADVVRRDEGDWGGYDIIKNPKPPSYGTNLGGNLRPVALDSHAFKNIAMRTQDPRFLTTSLSDFLKIDPFSARAGDVPQDVGRITFAQEYGTPNGMKDGKFRIDYKPQELVKTGRLSMDDALARPVLWAAKPRNNEYAAGERMYQQMGHDMGMAPADAQSSAWAGAGDLTGLGTPPDKTFGQMHNERLLLTAKMRNEDPRETLRKLIRREAPLFSEGGRVEGYLSEGGRPPRPSPKERAADARQKNAGRIAEIDAEVRANPGAYWRDMVTQTGRGLASIAEFPGLIGDGLNYISPSPDQQVPRWATSEGISDVLDSVFPDTTTKHGAEAGRELGSVLLNTLGLGIPANAGRVARGLGHGWNTLGMADTLTTSPDRAVPETTVAHAQGMAHGGKPRAARRDTSDDYAGGKASVIRNKAQGSPVEMAGGGPSRKLAKALKQELFPSSNSKQDAYLRFGEWPENERSQNFIGGDREAGVSVYPLAHERGVPHPAVPEGEWTLDDYSDRLRDTKTPRWLVEGDQVGLGGDGEPLLRDVRRLGEYGQPYNPLTSTPTERFADNYADGGPVDTPPEGDGGMSRGGTPQAERRDTSDDYAGSPTRIRRVLREIEYTKDFDKLFGGEARAAGDIVRRHTERTGNEGLIYGDAFGHSPLTRGDQTSVRDDTALSLLIELGERNARLDQPFFSMHSHPALSDVPGQYMSLDITPSQAAKHMQDRRIPGQISLSGPDMRFHSGSTPKHHRMMIEAGGGDDMRLMLGGEGSSQQASSQGANFMRMRPPIRPDVAKRMAEATKGLGMDPADPTGLSMLINKRLAEDVGLPLTIDARARTSAGQYLSDMLPDFEGYLSRHNALPFSHGGPV